MTKIFIPTFDFGELKQKVKIERARKLNSGLYKEVSPEISPSLYSFSGLKGMNVGAKGVIRKAEYGFKGPICKLWGRVAQLNRKKKKQNLQAPNIFFSRWSG